jgi:transposase
VLKKRFNNKKEDPANTLYIGVDIAKDRHCARCLNSVDDRKSRPVFFDNTIEGFEKITSQFDNWLAQFNCRELMIGMEPTAGYWLPLFYHLKNLNYDVKLISSLKVKRSKDIKDNSPLKNDEKDALLISTLLKDGNYIELRCEGNEKEVRKLLKHAEDLDKTVGVYRNLVEGFLSIHFPEYESVFEDLSTKTARQVLQEYPFPADIVDAGLEKIAELIKTASHGRMHPDKAARLIEVASKSIGIKEDAGIDRFTIDSKLRLLEITYSELNEVEKKLEQKVKLHPMYEILASVKFVGIKVIAAIIAYLGDLKNYDNYRQVLKMVGLNLYRFSSGKYRSGDHISRRGSSLLRRYLYMAALGNCREGSIYYEKYQSLISRGMPKKKAIVAIMRKMLKLLYALVRDNRKFEADYMPSRAKSDVNVIQRAAA